MTVNRSLSRLLFLMDFGAVVGCAWALQGHPGFAPGVAHNLQLFAFHPLRLSPALLTDGLLFRFSTATQRLRDMP